MGTVWLGVSHDAAVTGGCNWDYLQGLNLLIFPWGVAYILPSQCYAEPLMGLGAEDTDSIFISNFGILFVINFYSFHSIIYCIIILPILVTFAGASP